MTRVGIVVALAAESRSLTRRGLSPRSAVATLDSGDLLTLSGAGPGAAERGARRLVEAGAEALLSWGCAAALVPDLKPGDLVISDNIIGAAGEILATDSPWRNRLRQKLGADLVIHTAALAESREIVATPQDKQACAVRSGGIAVDMESAAIARLAVQLEKPFLAIRAIADPLSMSLPRAVLVSLDDQGEVQIAKLLRHALRHPAEFIGLVQLGRHFQAAMKTLKTVHRITGASGFSPA